MDRYAIARGGKPVTEKEIRIIAEDREMNQKLGGFSKIEISEKALKFLKSSGK